MLAADLVYKHAHCWFDNWLSLGFAIRHSEACKHLLYTRTLLVSYNQRPSKYGRTLLNTTQILFFFPF